VETEEEVGEGVVVLPGRVGSKGWAGVVAVRVVGRVLVVGVVVVEVVVVAVGVVVRVGDRWSEAPWRAGSAEQEAIRLTQLGQAFCV
jgi:hypothetical protein